LRKISITYTVSFTNWLWSSSFRTGSC